MAVRVRFAPSPTGPLHIGGVRTALYNYLFAKKHGGTFVLRIEDTDQNRCVDGAEAYIQNALAWLNISPDESPSNEGNYRPYRQSDRKSLYISNINKLVQSGEAYLAFDSPDELASLRSAAEANGETFIYNWQNRESLKNSLSLSEGETSALLKTSTPYVIRFKTFSKGSKKQLKLNDVIRGNVDIDTSLLDDKILVKQDGMPTYHLANVIDDHLMGISHVIRGEEWLPSMALHVLLYKAFGWDLPVFAHVPLILKPTGKGKLSKRDGAKFGFPVFPLTWDSNTPGFRESGYLPQALTNYIALLGWSPGGEKELFSLSELTKMFSLEAITKSGGRFDPERCKWFNQQYLQQVDSSLLVAVLEKEVKTNGVEKSDVDLTRVAKLIQNRLTLLTDVWREAGFFFVAPREFDEKALRKQWKPETAIVLAEVAALIGGANDTSATALSALIKNWAGENNIGLGKIMAPLRIALVGSLRGPDVFDICSTIGINSSVERINAALNHVSR